MLASKSFTPQQNISGRYYFRHLEKERARCKKYRLEHLDQIRERQREYRKQNKEKIKEYHRKLKLDVFGFYSNGVPICVCCGEKQLEFLTIDHIYNDGNKMRKEHKHRSGNTFYQWIQNNNYPDGLQVLCFNCNVAKGKLGKCPHIH